MSHAPVAAVLVALAVAAAHPAAAQTSDRRFEIGAQFSTLRLTDFDRTNAGLGGRLTFEVARWFAVEGDIDYFPRERVESHSGSDLTPDLRLAYSRERIGVFAGPKMGIRGERFGLFGRVQPGFTRLTHRSVDCLGEDCARVLLLMAPPQYRTEFAVTVRGIVEVYPSRRTVARLDLGSTLIRHRNRVPPCDDCTSRNLSSSVGFGVRF